MAESTSELKMMLSSVDKKLSISPWNYGKQKKLNKMGCDAMYAVYTVKYLAAEFEHALSSVSEPQIVRRCLHFVVFAAQTIRESHRKALEKDQKHISLLTCHRLQSGTNAFDAFTRRFSSGRRRVLSMMICPSVFD